MINFQSIKSGCTINCNIDGVSIQGAILHIGKINIDEGYVSAWICHSNPDREGDPSPEKYGMPYSWVFSCNLDGTNSGDVSDIRIIEDGLVYKQNVEISEDLVRFLQFSDSSRVDIIFHLKSGVMDEFTKYELSDKPGFIKLTHFSKEIGKSDKIVDIRLARFVRQATTALVKKYSGIFEMNLSDKDIENIHNNFLAFKNGSLLRLEILSGEDILQGYIRENYTSGKGTLHNSCMTDHLDYLELYTKNPSQVKLAVIKVNDKIHGRCLIWKTTTGLEVFDRVYFAHDWMEKHITKTLTEKGFVSVNKSEFNIVQLENWDFKAYPYLDSFYRFDKETGRLLALIGNYNMLRNTNGTIN